jgi:hypothetical protein
LAPFLKQTAPNISQPTAKPALFRSKRRRDEGQEDIDQSESSTVRWDHVLWATEASSRSVAQVDSCSAVPKLSEDVLQRSAVRLKALYLSGENDKTGCTAPRVVQSGPQKLQRIVQHW